MNKGAGHWFDLKVEAKHYVKRLIHSVLHLVAGDWSLLSGRVRIDGEANLPKKILILNGSHIGDIVISTSIFPILRAAFPEAKFGFVASSLSSMVLEGHPEVSWLHRLDHWRLNRGSLSMLRKVWCYWKTRRVALREIRQIGYDLSLSIYPWYPDFLDLAWRSGIPVRIGFDSSLFAPLATKVAHFPDNPFVHQSTRQAEILRPLCIPEGYYARKSASLAPSSEGDLQEVRNLLPRSEAQFCIIHMGSGEPSRELPPEFWSEVAGQLVERYCVVFTGKSAREYENARKAIGGLPNCVNACDQLSWRGFVAAVRQSEVLFGVESMAGHVASAVGTKSISAYAGAAGVARWRPEAKSLVFTNHVECAPCLRVKGCAEMNCLRNIDPVDLVAGLVKVEIG